MSAAESEVADDLRSQLEAAYKESTEAPETPEVPETPDVPETPETPEQAEARARDERGRFTKKADEPETPQAADKPADAPDTAAAPEAKDELPPVDGAAPAPPNGWTAEAKAKWHELPAEIQAAVQQREQDIAKFVGKTDEERQFGREMHKVVSPYMAIIQAEGGTPAGAVQQLLNTAYVLRAGTPQQKQQALMAVAQQYGIELGQAQADPNQTQMPPQMQQYIQRQQQLEQYLLQQQQQTTDRLQSEVQSELDAFAADPKHSHFEEVKAHMAALLRDGVAKDLQDAYEQATWARADIRATLLAQQRAEEEQKRRAEAKQRAEEARRKGLSISGGPGVSGSAPPGDRSLREELEAQMAASSGVV